jgi:hypothetical protein
MTKYLVGLILLILVQAPNALFAQNYTISGTVTDGKNGETLVGATVVLKENGKGAASNVYGFYSVTSETGTYTLVASYVGYEDYKQTVTLDKDQRISIALSPRSITTKTVEITGERNDDNVTKTTMGQIKLDINTIRSIPVFMGEVDVLKTIQLLPGVKGGSEGNAGFYVRGGGPDQNLILLDEATVYNAGHLFGFFSVFNGDAVKGINLIKGGMPAQYGGRLASVLDITMKDGNNQKFHADGGIGMIASRLTLQGPIKKNKASFIISGRRTYADILAQPFIPDTSPFKGSGYYFYDLNAKVNWQIGDRDRVFLSGYFGRDVFTFSNQDFGFKTKIAWGNATLTARWNHVFNDKLFSNVSLIFTDYKFSFDAAQDEFKLGFYSGIRDYNAKMDFTWVPNVRHNVKFGVNYIYHRFTPNNAYASAGDQEFDLGDPETLYANEGAIYISDDFDVTENFSISAGLRLSGFQQVGPFTRYYKDNQGYTTDSVNYSRGESIKLYGGLEPRLAVKYAFNSKMSIKASYTRNLQYLHLTNIASISLPTDLWFPSTERVKPQIGSQYSLGVFRNFADNTWETSVELYYKDMKNQIEYKDGYVPGSSLNDNLDNSLVFGKGWAYGAEFFVKKALGKTTGWLGYTLSWTQRKFDAINQGEPYFARYDRRHDIQFIITHEFNPKWTVSAVWVYSTGNALTLQTGRYIYDGNIVNEFGPRNAFRMVPYHRMDLSVTWTAKKTEKFTSAWNLSIYNVYSRQNPYFIYFAAEGDITQGQVKLSARQVSLFPIIPAITWNFSF